jgi:hypothetical protein
MTITAAPPDNLLRFIEKGLDLHQAVRVVLLYDPEGVTGDQESITDVQGRTWRCVHFWRNVYQVSHYFRNRDRDERTVLCVVPGRAFRGQLDLSFIPDAVGAVEEFIDASLPTALVSESPSRGNQAAYIPPSMLKRYRNLLTDNLGAAIRGLRELQRTNGDGPLTQTDILYMVVRASLPSASAEILRPEALADVGGLLELLLHPQAQKENHRGVLVDYLREVAGDDPQRAALVEIPVADLAIILSVCRVLEALGKPIDEFNLRGVGSPVPDHPRAMDAIQMALRSLDQRQDLRTRVDDLAVGRVPAHVNTTLIQLLRGTPEPLHQLVDRIPTRVAQELLTRKVDDALELTDIPDWMIEWSRVRPAEPSGATERHLENAVAILGDIETRLRVSVSDAQNFAALIEGYIKSEDACLELDLWRVDYHIEQFQDPNLLGRWDEARNRLRQRIRERLLNQNKQLADLVSAGVPQFLNHRRNVTYVLRDAVRQLGAVRPGGPRVWFVIFDGMRWDIWDRVVRPALEPLFELESVNSYLALLPSLTEVSRTALVSGKLPRHWQNFQGRSTRFESDLGAIAFGLNEHQANSDYLFHNRMENRASEARRILATEDRKGRNILIYNIIDEAVHEYQGDPFGLGRRVEQDLQDRILPELRMLVEDGDKVVISSDHGFIELDRADEQYVEVGAQFTSRGRATPAVSDVAWRYTTGIAVEGTIRTTFSGMGDFYSATGHTWFRRPGGGHTRYTHGGVSLQEMVVPGVVMKRRATTLTQLAWVEPPVEIDLDEEETKLFYLQLQCTGTERVTFELDATGAEITPASGAVSANSEIRLEVRVHGTLSLANIGIRGTGRTSSGAEIVLHSLSINVNVAERDDVVEFDTSPLDILERRP